MAKAAEPIPVGYHTITPNLIVRGAEEAIDFYKRAFGAEEFCRMHWPDGKEIMHAELKIGNSRFFVADELPGMPCRSPQSLGGASASLHVYVADADAAFKRAVEAGAQVRMPMEDAFWGDRYGQVVDPFGYEWGIATRKEDLTPDEIRERAKAWFAKMAAKPQAT